MESENSKPILLTDVDGVILNWEKSFLYWLQSVEGVKLKGTLFDFWITYDSFLIQHYVIKFNNSEHFEHLECFEDALAVLPQLAKTHDLIAISSCGNDPHIVEKRIKNLEKYELVFSKVICLPLGGCKKDVLEKFPSSIWVEDQHKNAVVGANLGHKTFLRRDEHTPNEVHPSVSVVDGWFEIQKKIV